MGWEQRGHNRYFYKKQRDGPRVRSIYVGCGETAHLIAKFHSSSADLEKLLRLKKSMEDWELERVEAATLTDADDLPEVEIEILKLLADHRELKKQSLCRKFQLHPQRLTFHFERLSGDGYISHVETRVSTGVDDVYFLEQKGREYLSRKNFI